MDICHHESLGIDCTNRGWSGIYIEATHTVSLGPPSPPTYHKHFGKITCWTAGGLSDFASGKNNKKHHLKGQFHEIFDFWFFHESVSPKHLGIPLRPFRIFSKIRGDIRGSRCSTGVFNTGGKWKKSSS
jgi:hypothetical protein